MTVVKLPALAGIYAKNPEKIIDMAKLKALPDKSREKPGVLVPIS